jgi:hypothetical protein
VLEAFFSVIDQLVRLQIVQVVEIFGGGGGKLLFRHFSPAGPRRRRRFPLHRESELFDLAANARTQRASDRRCHNGSGSRFEEVQICGLRASGQQFRLCDREFRVAADKLVVGHTIDFIAGL